MKSWYLGLLALTLISGCGGGTYYQVTDPSTGQVYYTREITRDNGATVLTDAKTNREVSIQNSEVMKITQDQYDSAVGVKK